MARVRARKHKKHTEIGERHAEEARDRERRREKDDRIYRLHLPEHKKPMGGERGGRKKGRKVEGWERREVAERNERERAEMRLEGRRVNSEPLNIESPSIPRGLLSREQRRTRS